MKSETRAVTLKAHAALNDRRHAPAVLGERWMPRDGACVASVRRFVRDLATDHEAADTAVEIAQLLVSELATNALVHDPSEEPVQIVVLREGRLLTVEIRDSCPALPTVRRVETMASHGRGLAIVHRLAHDWGWNPTPAGKSVWFQLAAWIS